MRSRSVAVREPADDGDGEPMALSQGGHRGRRRRPATPSTKTTWRPCRHGSATTPRLSRRRSRRCRRQPLTIKAHVVRSLGRGVERSRRCAGARHIPIGCCKHCPGLHPSARAEAARRHLAGSPRARRRRTQETHRQGSRCSPDERFADLFQLRQPGRGPDRRAHRHGQGGTIAVSGQVDRLVVTEEAVLIADYKTNHPAPTRTAEVPPAYVRQWRSTAPCSRAVYPAGRSGPPWSDRYA